MLLVSVVVALLASGWSDPQGAWLVLLGPWLDLLNPTFPRWWWMQLCGWLESPARCRSSPGGGQPSCCSLSGRWVSTMTLWPPRHLSASYILDGAKDIFLLLRMWWGQPRCTWWYPVSTVMPVCHHQRFPLGQPSFVGGSGRKLGPQCLRTLLPH